MLKVYSPRQWKTKFDLCFLSKLQLCLSFWWYCLLFILFLKFVIILLIVIGIFKVLFFVWTTVWYFGTDESFSNGLVSMDVSDFLRDSDQKMFVEYRFSCQNITSFNIIRENHILFVNWTQGKNTWKQEKIREYSGKIDLQNCHEPCKSNTPPWVFSTFFKLCRWYQIAQSASYDKY